MAPELLRVRTPEDTFDARLFLLPPLIAATLAMAAIMGGRVDRSPALAAVAGDVALLGAALVMAHAMLVSARNRLLGDPVVPLLATFPVSRWAVVRARTLPPSWPCCLIGAVAWLTVHVALHAAHAPPACHVAAALTMPALVAAAFAVGLLLALRESGRVVGKALLLAAMVLLVSMAGLPLDGFELEAPTAVAFRTAAGVLAALPTSWIGFSIRHAPAHPELPVSVALGLCGVAFLAFRAASKAAERWLDGDVLAAASARQAAEDRPRAPAPRRWLARRIAAALSPRDLSTWRLVELRPDPERLEAYLARVAIVTAVAGAAAWALGHDAASPRTGRLHSPIDPVTMLIGLQAVIWLLPWPWPRDARQGTSRYFGMPRFPLQDTHPVEPKGLRRWSVVSMSKLFLMAPPLVVLLLGSPSTRTTLARGAAAFGPIVILVLIGSQVEAQRMSMQDIRRAAWQRAHSPRIVNKLVLPAIVPALAWWLTGWRLAAWIQAAVLCLVAFAAWRAWRDVARRVRARDYDAEVV